MLTSRRAHACAAASFLLFAVPDIGLACPGMQAAPLPRAAGRVMASSSEKSQVQVIARAAQILRALEGEDSGLSLGEIAKRVDLARSTVQRIVASLEAEKLVIAA